MNKIHAVDFKLDGSGVVNILDTDVTHDPAKLELRQESMQQTESGAVIIRRFDLTDEEKHRQMEREIFEEPKTAEEKLRAGDPAASCPDHVEGQVEGGFLIRSGIIFERHRTGDRGHCQPIHQTQDEGSGYHDSAEACSVAPKGLNGDGNVSHGVP